MGFYNYTKFHTNPLDGCGDMEFENVLTHICTCSGGDLYPLLSFSTHNSSLEGATELKLASFCSS